RVDGWTSGCPPSGSSPRPLVHSSTRPLFAQRAGPGLHAPRAGVGGGVGLLSTPPGGADGVLRLAHPGAEPRDRAGQLPRGVLAADVLQDAGERVLLRLPDPGARLLRAGGP